MIRAIRSVSTERGRDPREHALFAFGGNGAVFAAGMARELRMDTVLVPPSAGVFSSFGLLYADVEHHYSRSFRRHLRGVDATAFNATLDALVAEAREQLAVDGFTGERADIKRHAGLHYQGQTFALIIPIPEAPLDPAALEEAFAAAHERNYGHRAGPDEPVEIVDLQVVGRGIPERCAGARHHPPRGPAGRAADAAAGLFRTRPRAGSKPR